MDADVEPASSGDSGYDDDTTKYMQEKSSTPFGQ